MFGEKEFDQLGFPTPEDTPTDSTCLTLLIPANSAWWAVYTGLLFLLTEESAWQQFEGGMTREEAAEEALLIWQDAMSRAETASCDLTVGTPFWDDESDVDDEEPVDMQPWYGEVTNPTAPAGELDFVENIALWIVTGLVAIATFEIGGVAPALAFHTTVEKFIILQKRGDAAATIRFVVDGEDAKFVNTAPYAPGDIIETEIITEETGGDHMLLIIQTE